jgi:hypothetical protein
LLRRLKDARDVAHSPTINEERPPTTPNKSRIGEAEEAAARRRIHRAAQPVHGVLLPLVPPPPAMANVSLVYLYAEAAATRARHPVKPGIFLAKQFMKLSRLRTSVHDDRKAGRGKTNP